MNIQKEPDGVSPPFTHGRGGRGGPRAHEAAGSVPSDSPHFVSFVSFVVKIQHPPALICAIVLFGLVMSITQVTLLREGLETSSGNELALALGLTAWLLGTAVGAAVGALLPVRWAKGALTVCGIIAVPLLFLALLTARSLPHLFGVAPGELLTLTQQLAGNALVYAPVCLLIGATFTLACRLQHISPRTVYLAEALGWLLGGAAGTWLLVDMQPFLIFSLLAVVLLTALLLLWEIRRLPLLVLIIGMVLVPLLPWPARWERATLMRQWSAQRILASRYTPYGHGLVLARDGQLALYENGHLALVLPESQSAEELAHLSLLQLAHPQRIFLVGALGGLLPEVLKYPVQEVVVVEHDVRLTRQVLLPALDPATRQALHDPRVHLRFGDGRRLLAHSGKWDAVLLNVPPPSTALANQFFTLEFFRQARRALTPGGVLAFALPGADDFYSDKLLQRNGAVYRALAAAFPRVAVSPLATNYFLASDAPLTLDSTELGRRLTARHIATQLVDAYYFASILPRPLRGDHAKLCHARAAQSRFAAGGVSARPRTAAAE